jgi:hypothetical protein
VHISCYFIVLQISLIINLHVENEETAKQLVAASETSTKSTENEKVDAVAPNVDESPKIVEPVKETATSSSPSLVPVSSFSWADDIPDDNSDEDDIENLIPSDWIKPKTTEQETSASTENAVNESKEPTTTDLPTKIDEEAAVTAWNSLSQEPASEPIKSKNDENKEEAAVTTITTSREEATAYTWGALNDYQEPKAFIPKPQDIPKIGKEEEEAAIAAWQSAKLPEVPDEETDVFTTKEEELTWNKPAVEQPSWNQSTETSWNQSTEEPKPATDNQQQQQELASELKPTYTWGALNDYKEPEVVVKPKSELINLSKEDEAAAVSAWNTVKLPEEPQNEKEEKPQDTLSSGFNAQEFKPVQAETSWNAAASQGSNPVQSEPTWNDTLQEESWNAVQQPSWSEPLTTEGSSSDQQQDLNNSNSQETYSFTESSSNSGSSIKPSIKDTWKNKLPTTVEDNAGSWKSFAETAAIVPEPTKKKVQDIKTKQNDSIDMTPTWGTTLKKEETVSSWDSPLKEPSQNGAITDLSHPKPSQQNRHEVSFSLNDFNNSTNNEVHVSLKDIQEQNQKLSIKDDKSSREMTFNFSGLSPSRSVDPEEEIVLRLSDLAAGGPWKNSGQQEEDEPQEITLSFNELNKNRNTASANEVSFKLSDMSPSTATTATTESEPQEITYKFSDFNKDKSDEPMEVTLKLW